jgi:hypothetical protein
MGKKPKNDARGYSTGSSAVPATKSTSKSSIVSTESGSACLFHSCLYLLLNKYDRYYYYMYYTYMVLALAQEPPIVSLPVEIEKELLELIHAGNEHRQSRTI